MTNVETNGATEGPHAMFLAAVDLADLVDGLLNKYDKLAANVSRVDWAYYRFATLRLLIEDESGAASAAALARSLLEEAALWDWATGRGGTDWVSDWVSSERARLETAADPSDKLWLEWLLPPGTTVEPANAAVPTAENAVRRFGNGFEPVVLGPLQVTGLYGAYRVLSVLTHGGPGAALLMSVPAIPVMPAKMAAAALHVGGAATAALTIAQLDLDSREEALVTTRAQALADAACRVHGLGMGSAVKRVPAVGRKQNVGVAAQITSSITRLPPAQPEMSAAASAFLVAADAVGRAIDTLGAPVADAAGWIGIHMLRVGFEHLNVLRGAVHGTLATALVPFAARALFEDGARLNWVAVQPDLGSGRALKALLGEAQAQLGEARKFMLNEGMPRTFVDEITAPASAFLEAPPTGERLPPLEEMLNAAYVARSGLSAIAMPMYSVLSQFVHATPIAVMHLKRDRFPSLSAPVHAVTVDAACIGFTAIAHRGTGMAFGERGLGDVLGDLYAALRRVRSVASSIHCLD